MRRRTIGLTLAAVAAVTAGHGWTADPPKGGGKAGEDGLVRAVVDARRQYQSSLLELYRHYATVGDKERAKWVEDELKGYHLTPKPAYVLDIVDQLPAGLDPKENDEQANALFRAAMEYKGKGFGTDYLLNQRRAELLFHQILQEHRTSDKLADVAYELGELYEGRAFQQYARSATYYIRSCEWRKGNRTDARIRAARLYDKQLNEREKAIKTYRDVVAHDTDPERIKEADKRLATLTGNRR